ncbi:hypothetical protein J3R30DRAFT_3580234 [Lentinula aciculospora]|uniref:EF-hand domain-containing protein n=1 Tax=Lentinula aciculospora TaxID=153920 RepID=A0A9W9DFU2_9AGAR|nr:hypothetical protein J3R30DRAFT_3580234 [Lentinula aciculospora]
MDIPNVNHRTSKVGTEAEVQAEEPLPVPAPVLLSPLSVARQSSADILEKVGNLVKVESLKSSIDKTDKTKNTRRILEYLRDGLKYAEIIAQANDIAQGVVSILQAILEQELNRRRNNDQITVVYYTLSSTVLTIRHIKENGFDDQIRNELRNKYEGVYDLVKEFVGFLRASEFKPKLESLINDCKTYQEDILYLLQIHIASSVESTRESLVNLGRNVDSALKLLSKLDEAETRKEVEAKEFMSVRGVDMQSIIQDENTLAELAAIFNERVTLETKEILHKDMKDILEESMDDFGSKIEQVRKDINVNVQMSQAEILAKLNAGPHNLIEDNVFRELWAVEHNSCQGWRASVKSRIFVDEICSWVRIEFEKYSISEGHMRSDNWTLPILTQVMFHPAISDAIDDDGSGYVSIHEFNMFLKRKPMGWTFPMWLIFWAIGWQGIIFTSSERINKIVDRLLAVCEDAKAKADTTTTTTGTNKLTTKINKYTQSLRMVSKLTSWYTTTGYQNDFISDVMQVQFYDELTPLGVEYEKLHKDLARRVVNRDGVLVEISDTVILKKQFGERVESWLLPFLENILAQQLDVLGEKQLIEKEKNDEPSPALLGLDNTDELTDRVPKTASVTYENWVDMDWTLAILLYEFHLRLQSLIRGWRRQKIDYQTMVHSFSGGIFAGWHAACFDRTNYEFHQQLKVLESIYNRDSEEGEEEEEGTQNPNTAIALQDSVASLSASVSQLHSSMGELTRMVETQKDLLISRRDSSPYAGPQFHPELSPPFNPQKESPFIPNFPPHTSYPQRPTDIHTQARAQQQQRSDSGVSFEPRMYGHDFPHDLQWDPSRPPRPARYYVPKQSDDFDSQSSNPLPSIRSGYHFQRQHQDAGYPTQQQYTSYPFQQQHAAYPPQSSHFLHQQITSDYSPYVRYPHWQNVGYPLQQQQQKHATGSSDVATQVRPMNSGFGFGYGYGKSEMDPDGDGDILVRAWPGMGS